MIFNLFRTEESEVASNITIRRQEQGHLFVV